MQMKISRVTNSHSTNKDEYGFGHFLQPQRCDDAMQQYRFCIFVVSLNVWLCFIYIYET